MTTAFGVGCRGDGDNPLEGYLSEFYFIDGLQYAASDFGELSSTTNQWIPKDASGLTFGTNGFYQKYGSTELADSFEDSAERSVLTVTANGTAELDTAIKKIGTASAYWGSTSGGDSDTITIPSTDGSFDFGSGDFTIEMWIKSQGPISAHESPLSRYIVSGEPGFYLFINQSSGNPYVRFNDSSNAEVNIPITIDIRNDNTWHHCVWSFDRSSNCISYHNGSSNTTTSITSQNASCNISQTFRIGQNSASSQKFLGGISNIKYYNKALSATEVLQNYNMHKSRFG